LAKSKEPILPLTCYQFPFYFILPLKMSIPGLVMPGLGVKFDLMQE
jgi:hypothetical protein